MREIRKEGSHAKSPYFLGRMQVEEKKKYVEEKKYVEWKKVSRIRVTLWERTEGIHATGVSFPVLQYYSQRQWTLKDASLQKPKHPRCPGKKTNRTN
ncbi:hypothetical protein HZH66_008391 [Vespula vulgaris]|uniref:Uncharacterized protein n=1 Tax=Vespula vulgaris TaxID=7454 RepID=A0A834JPS5_VESVU|nr:hypothetical protein HZH66_008391 [Vespula vulgaris]